MDSPKTAILFPGQGACYPGALSKITAAYPLAHLVAEVDEIARNRFNRSVSEFLWDTKISSLEQMLQEPDLLQLSIFTISIVMYRVLMAEGVRADVLMGHSLGEIAALTCAGALSVADGAAIVCDRAQASQLAAGVGYMAAITADPATAERLVGLVGNHTTAVAVENGIKQTVISGKHTAMDRVSELARVLNIGFTRLRSPYPFHTRLMEPAQEQFLQLLRRYTFKPLTKPVFSPILDRYYEDSDPLAELMAQHLTRPVRFAGALERLYSEGVTTFVEAGALDALTKLTRNTLSDRNVQAFALLPGNSNELEATQDVLKKLGVAPRPSSPVSVIEFLSDKNIPVEMHGPFWSQCGTAIEQFVSGQYQLFSRQSISTVNTESRRPAPVTSLDRSAVLKDLTAMYAAALEYPEEVFAEKTELEAELGIDSVKQTELLARVSERYQLPPRSADFRLSNFSTLGKVADLVCASADSPAPPAQGAPQPSESPFLPPAKNSVASVNNHATVLKDLVSLYAQALEYPEEVFNAEVDLEGELGVDSVKQTELLARVSDQYDLPPRSADFRLSHYNTLGKITDLIIRSKVGETSVHPAILLPSTNHTAALRFA